MDLQEHPGVSSTADDEELSLHHGSAQRKKKKKKKRRSEEEGVAAGCLKDPKEEEEEATLPPAADQTQNPDRKKKKKKKKRKWEEPPAGDFHTPQKKKEEEEVVPAGPTQRQEKKKKTPQKKKEEEEVVSVGPTQRQEKKKKTTPQKKKQGLGDARSSREEEEEEALDWAQVAELHEFLPHIGQKCTNQIKKILTYDLHRFRSFRQQGIPARLGRFSEKENQLIRDNVADFLAMSGIESAEKLLFPQRFKEEQAAIKKLKKELRFMERVADRIPRPCHQVYLRALKLFDEKNHMGRFSEEEVATLVRLHSLHGNNWKLISEKMDRSIYSLQKRFSAIGVGHGAWSGEEERRLKQAVREHLESRVRNDPGPGPGSGSGLTRDQLHKRLPWKEISQKVQTRSWVQCRNKWMFFLEHRMTWYGNVFNRGAEGCEAKLRLINTLYNSSIEDVADINWEEVAQAVGDVTPWSVQRMFSRLKQRKVPHAHCLSFGEIIDFLHQRVVPVLKNRLLSSDRWAGLQEQHGTGRYQLADIFNSDIEDEDGDMEVCS